jgi:protein disulfide-isomerase-like protein
MSKILGFIFLGLLFQISASHYVLELTDKNFQEALDLNPSLMIDFYATWCGHCQHFKPIYEETSKELKEKNMKTVLARIDAYYYTDIKHAWKVGGYPTILYFQNGQLIEKYPGARKVEAIVEYLAEKESGLAN